MGTNPMHHDQWNHRGWEITADYSCPSDQHTWTATSPDFDVDLRDGEFVPLGGHVHAATYAELLMEIDMWIEDNAPPTLREIIAAEISVGDKWATADRIIKALAKAGVA